MTTTFNPIIASEDMPRPFHWTVEAYHRAWNAGVFGHEARVELVLGRVIDRFTDTGPRDYHWTADDFDRACDADVFPEASRLELLNGRIVDRMGQGPMHSILATLIAERLRAVLPSGLLVREEKPVRIAFDGEPVADIMVVGAVILNDLAYYAAHQVGPEDVLLIVEVAVSSEVNDLGEKAVLYAQSGISDYWVALPERQQIIIHRNPCPNGYESVQALTINDKVSPLAAEGVALAVRDLLGLSATGTQTE